MMRINGAQTELGEGLESSPRRGWSGRRREPRAPRDLRPREVELRKLLPNMITAASLCAGLASVHFSMIGQLREAVLAIVISFILDGLDGRMARLLRVTSNFGEVFDSMADFMAFGVAPAFLIYQWQFKSLGGAGITGAGASRDIELMGQAACMLFALCAAIRLARFAANASKKKPGTPTSKFFSGLPAPAAGGAVVVPVMLALSPTVGYTMPVWATLTITTVLALLMVSKIPMMSIKGVKISRALAPLLLALVAVLALGVMRDGWLTSAVVFTLYVMTMPIGFVQYRRALAKEASELAGMGPREGTVA